MDLKSFLIILTKSQENFIKGGVFQDYLYTLGIPPNINKKIDLVIMIISMNIVWVASGLVGRADFIILYEPFNGLDQHSQSMLLTILKEKARCSGLIFTTHH